MSPSARLAQETTITYDRGSNLWHCMACLIDFEFADLNDPAVTPPKFCPNCGRRAAETKEVTQQ